MGKRKTGHTFHQRGLAMTSRQIEWLDAESRRLDIPAAELMRRALDEYIERSERLPLPRVRRRTPTKSQGGSKRQTEMPLKDAA